MGRLTTHILDTAHGGPAPNVDIRLFSLGEARELITSTTTNADGRAPNPLLEGDLMISGSYELEFCIRITGWSSWLRVTNTPMFSSIRFRSYCGL